MEPVHVQHMYSVQLNLVYHGVPGYTDISSQAFLTKFSKKKQTISRNSFSGNICCVRLLEARQIGSPQHPYRKEIDYLRQFIRFRIVSYINLRDSGREKERENMCLKVKPELKGRTQFWKEGEPRSKGASLQA